MSNLRPDRATFRKSSYSEGANGCVEVCAAGSQHFVRDSKNPHGGTLVLDGASWKLLVGRIKQGALDW
ncbi:DUF397 domain-containing protein [Actinomadura fibrosa]|uniref:DUF397 domain-containing protein n=1 Tax=Actinomadura fibrosa TaxID=111802 RepID=A0ABW2XC07_9ACTN|nr:DUF397 domain-containing protein [Actinomadura fibrosa]